MRLRSHDQGFVGASPDRVYEALADPAGYGEWWPEGSEGSGDRVSLRLGRRPSTAFPERHRPGVGLFLRLGPPTEGTLEWFLEPFEEGTLVNCFLDLDLSGGPRRAGRRLRRIRTAVRRGMVALLKAVR